MRMQYAEREECSMQSEGNAVCREKGMQNHTAESPAYRLVLYITHMQRTATGECSMQNEENAVCRVRGMQSEKNGM